MSPERDDYRDEDEQDEYTPRSIFAAGWFRAALVLTVLAIVVVISLPYLLNWFEPVPPPRVAREGDPAPAGVPVPAPSKPAAATPEPKAAIAPPAVSPPAPRAVEKRSLTDAETAVAPAPARPAEPEKPAARTAARAFPQKAAKPADAPAVKSADKGDRVPAKAAHAAAAKSAEKPAPARVARTEAPAKPQPTAKTSPPAPAKSPLAAKSEAPTVKAQPVAARMEPTEPARSSAAPGKPSAGNYWVQLGAFKDRENADDLAKSVRDDGFAVHVTRITRGDGGAANASVQQHELFVTDARADKVNAALKGRGTAQPVAGGVAVRPAYGLQEAMTVSKRLTDEGLKVIIRPVGGPVAAAASSATLYAVRAGGYADRSSAVTARDRLAGKGHRGFLAEGPPR